MGEFDVNPSGANPSEEEKSAAEVAKELNDSSAESAQLDMLLEKIASAQEEIAKSEEEEVPLSPLGADSYVRISEDGMTAYLLLGTPEEGADPYDIDDIMDFIDENGVTYGVEMGRINGMLIAGMYDREEEIAFGTPMVEGNDGYYEYFFSPDAHTGPKVLEDGSVDYQAMHMLQNVKAGDKLALYHHAAPGTEGTDVRGNVIKPAPVKDLNPLKVMNISIEEDPDVFVSLIDGKVELKGDRIDIQATHEIRGDVDYLMGKIEFYGDIIVNGNVESGVTLRAGRNIVINGTAAGASLFAGGDIIISKGVTGSQTAKLSARGNIFSNFLEYCNVDAGGNVEANAILDSHVNASGKVVATGGKGRIIGGYVHGMLGMVSGSAGNNTEIKTIIHSGYEPKTYEEVVRLTNEEKAQTEKLQQVVAEMTEIIQAKAQKNWKAKALETKLPELEERKNAIYRNLDTIRSDIEFYKMILEKGKGSKIEIKGPVHAGVLISIETSNMPIDKDTSYTRFFKAGGRVQSEVLVL